MKRRPRIFTPIIYSLAFLVLPVVIGVFMAMRTLMDIHIQAPPAFAPESAPSPPHDPSKRTAAIIVGNTGTEITDFMAPFALLSAANVFNVYAVAPRRQLAPFNGGVDILPHFSFAEFDHTAGPHLDLLVIPNIPHIEDPDNQPIIRWIQEHAGKNTLILSICEGARTLAATGMLANRKATTHWWVIDQLEQQYPDTQWVRGARYVEDGNIISGTGVVTGSMDATLYTLQKLAGRQVAHDVARQFRYPLHLESPAFTSPRFRPSEYGLLLLNAGYIWDKTDIGVVLYAGVDEMALTAVLDTYPRTLAARTFTVAPVRTVIRSKYGLSLVPRLEFASVAALDRLLIPGNDLPASITRRVEQWTQDKPHLQAEYLPVLSGPVSDTTPGHFAFDIAVTELARRTNIPVAHTVATMLEYPSEHLQLEGRGWPLHLLLRPILIGCVAVAVVRIFMARKDRKA